MNRMANKNAMIQYFNILSSNLKDMDILDKFSIGIKLGGLGKRNKSSPEGTGELLSAAYASTGAMVLSKKESLSCKR